MATCPVRFEFQCEKGKLKYSHNIPRSLVAAIDPRGAPDAAYMKTYMNTIQPILEEHEPACRAASSAQCGQCGARTAKILLTPMSWLHVVDNPFVNIFANPVCVNDACDAKTRQQIQDMMALLTSNGVAHPQAETSSPGTNSEEVLLPCRVCDNRDKTFRCARCKAVAYCGKEHQKADWGMHKKDCKSATDIWGT